MCGPLEHLGGQALIIPPPIPIPPLLMIVLFSLTALKKKWPVSISCDPLLSLKDFARMLKTLFLYHSSIKFTSVLPVRWRRREGEAACIWGKETHPHHICAGKRSRYFSSVFWFPFCDICFLCAILFEGCGGKNWRRRWRRQCRRR